MRPGEPGGAGRRVFGDVAKVGDELDVACREIAFERGPLLQLDAQGQLFHRLQAASARRVNSATYPAPDTTVVSNVTQASATTISGVGNPLAAPRIAASATASWNPVLILLISVGRPCNGPKVNRYNTAPLPISTSRATAT